MAAKREADQDKQPRKSEKINLWLMPEQIEWLKRDKDGPSAAVRALITEAINLENLARSIKGGRKRSETAAPSKRR